MDIAYIESYHGDWVSYTILKPTGRWRMESGSYGKDDIFVEHQTFIWFIKWWIHEDDIHFLPEPEVIQFNCKKR
jgi:hypothetical protein